MDHCHSDFYTIPWQDKWVIYKPQRQLAFIGNAALAKYILKRNHGATIKTDPEIEQFLERIGFDLPGLECPIPELESACSPAAAVLLMTNRCNLRCVYCYANAGEEPCLSDITWPAAKAAIDHVLENAERTGVTPSLTFHGGGEPTIHWELLTKAVIYARAAEPSTRVSMSSNGMWTESQRRFICRHFTNVSLSMDGLADVQNRQRPMADVSESAPTVAKSIRALDEAGIDYGIRMTVMPDSVGELAAGVKHICATTRTLAIQVEPTFTRCRGQYGDIDEDFAEDFAEHFMEAWRVGRSFNRQVYYSAARPWVIASTFCQAPLKAVVVTADGRLVTCFEVFSAASPLARGFTVGQVCDGQVKYDHAALQAFLDTQQSRRHECRDCFCYWHCCGDCATRRPGSRQESTGRCHVTRRITLMLLLEYIHEGGGVWMGLRKATAAFRPKRHPGAACETTPFESKL